MTHTLSAASHKRTQRSTRIRHIRKSWSWLGLTAALFITALPLLTMTAAAPSPSQLQNRAPAVEFIEDSEPTTELTFEANDSYYLQPLTLGECQNNLVLPENGTHVRNYAAMTTLVPDMALNYYLDENCQEYDFSIVSEVREFVGAFASIKYVGQFSNAKQGFYENTEFSKTVLPDSDSEPGPPESGRQPPVSPDKATSGGGISSTANSAGLAIGMGIIGMVILSGMIGAAVFVYRKYGPEGRKRGGDGGAFMTLSTDGDAEEQVGLTGENGPNSSALMQSRVDVSFDDERYPAGYRDEDKDSDDDDGEVELGAYPHSQAGSGSQPTAKLQ